MKPPFQTKSSRINFFAIAALASLIFFYFSLPEPLFNKPISTVIDASNGQLLGAKIAEDGQWRFPLSDSIPHKFELSIITFEDKRFYSHFGVDFRAMGRALIQNLKNQRITSGGSTISMQVMRLARGGRRRTILLKSIETILSFRLEFKYSKREILSLYASNAPFGGNVVGLEAASWRYFGKNPYQLTWAEAATLAVLPNNPSIIHPGKNRTILKAKRDQLLKKLHETKRIGDESYELALQEPLPDKPHPLPRLAPHLLEKIALKKNKNRRTTIDADLQLKITQIADRHNLLLKNNEIHNLAIIVLDIDKKQVLGYIGNAPNAGLDHGQSVDIIQSPRSTGSIMKPFLYAMLMQEGSILPKSTIADIPTYLQDFRPENYSKTYDGVVPANEALSRSLNIPFVRMLQIYGVEKFHYNLKKLGITTLRSGPEHYGLSLILGGAEATLWDLTNIYAGMARRLNRYYSNSGRYNEKDFLKAEFYPKPLFEKTKTPALSKTSSYLTADVIWLTFNAMTKLERPDDQGDWQRFEDHQKIAWKTGTSFGFRDAWAIGVNSKYAVGVWVGNADGEGRPSLTGVTCAAPILFDVFDFLPTDQWFDQPFDAMKLIATCRQSGFLAKDGCEVDSVWVSGNSMLTPSCPYHQKVHLDKTETFQVNMECYSNDLSVQKYWFVLPPIEEYYFKPKHPNYKPLPLFLTNCAKSEGIMMNPIELVYPSFSAKIYIPIELDEENSKTVFKAVHKTSGISLLWHLDNEYIGSTQEFHTMELSPAIGKHILTILDEKGNGLEQKFEILRKGN